MRAGARSVDIASPGSTQHAQDRVSVPSEPHRTTALGAADCELSAKAPRPCVRPSRRDGAVGQGAKAESESDRPARLTDVVVAGRQCLLCFADGWSAKMHGSARPQVCHPFPANHGLARQAAQCAAPRAWNWSQDSLPPGSTIHPDRSVEGAPALVRAAAQVPLQAAAPPSVLGLVRPVAPCAAPSARSWPQGAQPSGFTVLPDRTVSKGRLRLSARPPEFLFWPQCLIPSSPAQGRGPGATPTAVGAAGGPTH